MKYEVNGWDMDAKKHLVAPIAATDFEAVKEAQEYCLNAVAFEERIHLVYDNFNDLEVDLLRLGQKTLMGGSRTHTEAMQDRLLLDRRIANLLTTCRIYVDQSAHGFSSVFGHNSSEMKQLAAEKSRLYDNHFGYRFLDALRNVVQHSAVPVHSILFKTASAGTSSEYTVVPLVILSNLEREDFKRSVLEEARGLGKDLDLRGPIREYVSCLHQLHIFMRNLADKRYTDAFAAYESAIARHSTISGRKVALSELQCIDDNKQSHPSTSVQLTDHFVPYYRHLRTRAINAQGLTTKYVSGGYLVPKTLPTTAPLEVQTIAHAKRPSLKRPRQLRGK